MSGSGHRPRLLGTERGAATVLAVALSGLVLLVAMAAVWLGGVVARHRTAQAAADLAALAGADAAQRGAAACAAAATVASANGADLTSCVSLGLDVRVEVVVPPPLWQGLAPPIHGRARAGPKAVAQPADGARGPGSTTRSP